MNRKPAVSTRESGGRGREVIGSDNLNCVPSAWEDFVLFNGIGTNELILSHSYT